MYSYRDIKTPEDVVLLKESANSLHDGYIVDIKYSNNITVTKEDFISISPEEKTLAMKILITSMKDCPTVELVFDNITEIHILPQKDEIFDFTVSFAQDGLITWRDEFAEGAICNSVSAYSMRWRFA